MADAIEISPLKSVSYTFEGGTPDKKAAWSNPAINTTGYFNLASGSVELSI